MVPEAPVLVVPETKLVSTRPSLEKPCLSREQPFRFCIVGVRSRRLQQNGERSHLEGRPGPRERRHARPTAFVHRVAASVYYTWLRSLPKRHQSHTHLNHRHTPQRLSRPSTRPWSLAQDGVQCLCISVWVQAARRRVVAAVDEKSQLRKHAMYISTFSLAIDICQS